jgi:PAS domain S-box-containing protein
MAFDPPFLSFPGKNQTLMKKDNPPTGTAALRRKALKKPKEQAGRLPKLSSEDTQRVITELGAHQIELEMQNEELRKTQVELEASRRKYADLYDFSPVGYFSFDRRGLILDANLTGAGQLGQNKRELITKPFPVFIADDEGLKTFVDHCAAILRTGAGAACELKLKRKDGALFHARLQSIVAGNEEGALFVRSAMSDVTSLKEMETRLRDSEDRFRRIAETSADVIFQLDAQGRVAYVSPAVNRYGYKPEAIIGTPFTAYVDHRDLAKAADAFERAASGNRTDMLELRLRYATGASYHAEVNVTPVKKHGAVVGIQGISRDITTRKSLETALRRTNTDLEAVNKELEAFSFTIANDLRAPLRTIEGFTRAILEDYADRLDATATDYFSRIQAATRRMDQYIGAMWTMSSLTRRELAENTVDLHAVAQEIAGDLQRRQPERKADFVIADGARVRGDQEMLRIALENLLDNAWKFTDKRQPAKIEFGVAEADGKKTFFIRDNGAGFNMAFADKLFQPFRRLHTDAEFPGIGIGLAIAHHIIKRHGGRMWAEGEVGKGATFSFTL